MTDPLPIDDVIPDIVGALRDHRKVVIEAPPGAGKSTRVPPAVLDAGITDKSIVVLEPRRVAARAVASRIAEERGQSVGDEVGWHIRFDRRGGAGTRLWVITEGILTRRIQSEPFLDDIGCLVIDEFHERSIHTDLAIGFARELLEMRDDLHVAVMSATLDAASIASYLDAPSVVSEGRTHPVDVDYIDHEVDDLPREVARAVSRLLSDPSDNGDILVFLPGLRSIDECRNACRRIADDQGVELHRLHGRLPETEQQAALRTSTARKVIFSTNIAETSLTIEGLTSVVDSGLVKVVRLDPSTGYDRLVTQRVSLASAKQRAGRAGRVRPGRAIRLWTPASEFRMSDYDEPELHRVDLTGPILEVLAWSGEDPSDFPWFEPPPASRLDAASTTLRSLGAVRDAKLTPVGRRLCKMPLHPRIGRFLIAANDLGVGTFAADIAACMSEPSWMKLARDAPPTKSDVLLRARLLRPAAMGDVGPLRQAHASASRGAARNTLRIARDLSRWCDEEDHDEPARRGARRAMLTAYADRVAFKRTDRRYAMVGGGSIALAWESTLDAPDVLVATEIFGTAFVDGVECGLARQATEVERDWLRRDLPHLFSVNTSVRFDHELERVVARREVLFGDVSLESEAVSLDDVADPSAIAESLATAVADDPVRAFGLEKDALRFFQRVEFLRFAVPELALPDPHDPAFVTRMLWGKSSFAELRRSSFRDLYAPFLQGEHFAALDRMAPDRFQFPSGRSHRIDYSDPEQPVLAARIQDFFGMNHTPRIADGKVSVLLHLLAPNMRPQQVTMDLRSFWEKTYAEVRKELRARYPKHDWPENPNP